MAKEINVINPQVINLIAKGTKITGDLISDGDIRVDGELTGNLDTKGRLVIGASGRVEGDISCKSCEIAGTQTGKMVISELLSLRTSSKVSSNVITGKLSIEPGAFFVGTCSMGDDTTKNE